MNRAAHLALVVAVAALVAGCGGSSGGAPTAASSSSSAPSTPSSGGSLEALALTAAEATKYGGQPVGANPPVSTALGRGPGATLDVCNASFPSEALRQERYQEFFTAPDDPKTIVESNEVVRYQPGGTAQAYRELRSVVRHCTAMSTHGFRVSKPKIDPRSTNLAAHQLTLEFSQSHAGKTVYSAAVYQYEGDLFDGIYVFRGSPQDALTAVRRLAHYIAPKLATAAAPAV